MPTTAAHHRLTLVIPSLDCGGAERVMVTLASGLAEHGHAVRLLTTEPGVPDFFTVPAGIERRSLPADTVTSCRWYDARCQRDRGRRWREALLDGQPELVLSFLDTTNIATLLALSGQAVPVVAVEHTDPRVHRIGWRWALLRRFAYPRAAAVVMLTEGTRRWALAQWPRWRVWPRPIPNPVSPPAATPRPERPACFGPRNVVGMGRLGPGKGFDLLIEAFARLAGDHPNWHLSLFGEGTGRMDLERQAHALGLADRIHMPGRIPHPERVLPSADLFVLSSRYEGFPMVLTEAMVAGLPVISFECSSGPGEIVRDGVDGLLVPPGDVDRLTVAMAALMGDACRRRTLGRRGPEVADRFSQTRILALWEALIETVLADARR